MRLQVCDHVVHPIISLIQMRTPKKVDDKRLRTLRMRQVSVTLFCSSIDSLWSAVHWERDLLFFDFTADKCLLKTGVPPWIAMASSVCLVVLYYKPTSFTIRRIFWIRCLLSWWLAEPPPELLPEFCGLMWHHLADLTPQNKNSFQQNLGGAV